MPHSSPRSSDSPRLSRRGLLATGGAAGLGALLAACGGGSGGGPASGDGEGGGGAWSFTDDRKKKVSLDAVPHRIVAYVGAAAALYDYGLPQDRIAGVFGPTKKKNGEADVLAGDLDVDGLEVIGNAYGQFDLEKYAKVRPELLVTNMFLPGDLWYVPHESKQKILQLAPAVAVKVAKTPMLEPVRRYEQLAKSLGADVRAKKVTDAKSRFQKASESLRKAAQAAGGVKVMAASGYPDMLYVSDPSANSDLSYFKELGVDFVVPEKTGKDGFYEELSWENADTYPADLIMLDNRTQALQPDALKSKPSWADLPAVKAHQVTEWNPEPRFSYAGTAPLIEQLAKAVQDAKKVR